MIACDCICCLYDWPVKLACRLAAIEAACYQIVMTVAIETDRLINVSDDNNEQTDSDDKPDSAVSVPGHNIAYLCYYI